MRSGDCISWSGDNLFSRMIRIWTPRSHISIVVDSPPGWPERRFIIEAAEGEVNPRILSKKLANYDGHAWWHPLKPEFYLYRAELAKCFWDLIGIDYDDLGLVANVGGLVDEDDSAFFCSELAGYGYKKVIPIEYLKKFLPNHNLNLLLKGKALRPGGITGLPLFLSETEIL